MTGDCKPLNRWVCLGHSVGPALILLWLLHRAMARTEAQPDALFLRGFQDFGQLRWTWPYLIAVGVACVWVVLRRNHTELLRVQWIALGCDLSVETDNTEVGGIAAFGARSLVAWSSASFTRLRQRAIPPFREGVVRAGAALTDRK